MVIQTAADPSQGKTYSARVELVELVGQGREKGNMSNRCCSVWQEDML